MHRVDRKGQIYVRVGAARGGGGGGEGRGGAGGGGGRGTGGTATHANTLETAILSKFDLLHLGGSASRRNCVIFFSYYESCLTLIFIAGRA